jgi:cell division protein FtsQ
LESDLLNLKHLDLKGSKVVSYEEIVEASQLIFDRNIYKFDLDAIEENIKSHPYVKTARVKRRLPNRIEVSIEERTEFAIISYIGSYIYVDPELIALRYSDSYLLQELPLITGVELKSLKLGEAIDSANSNLQDAIKVVAAAKVTDMVDIISEINVSEESNLRLKTHDGFEVLLGKADDPVYSMLVLKEVLVKLYTNNRRNVIIDLRYNGTTVVRDKNN